MELLRFAATRLLSRQAKLIPHRPRSFILEMLVPELIWTLCRLLRCSSDSCGEVKHACRKNTK